ncbi:MAG: autotransporter domain-containing protein [Planctomycetota bacterium]
MPTLRFSTAVLLAAVTPLGWSSVAVAQPFADTPITSDATNNLPSQIPIVINSAGPGTLTYTNEDGGSLLGGITFQGDVTINNEAGINLAAPDNIVNRTDGGILGGIFQANQAGVLTFLNEGLLNGSVGTSGVTGLGGDDVVTLLTTGEIRGSIALGVENDEIILRGGEADSAPGADDGDRIGSLALNGVFDVETLTIDGEAGLVGDDRPVWVLNGIQNESSVFTNGVTIGGSQPVVVFLNSSIIRTGTGAGNEIQVGNDSDFFINGIVEGDLTAQSGGTIAPNGFSQVNGDVTFENGSILETFVNGAGQSLRLDVDGDVDIQTTTLDVNEGGEIFGEVTTAQVLTSTGTLTGDFNSVTTDFTFLDGVTSVADGVVTLTLTRNGTGISNDAATENQRQAGLALEVIDAIADPTDAPAQQALADAYAALATPAQQQAALDSLSGESLASAPRVATFASRGFARGMDRRSRMMQVYLAEGNLLPTPQLASNAGLTHDLQLLQAAALAQPGQVAAIDTFVPGFWIDVLGGDGDIDGDGSFAGLDYEYYGLVGGFDIQISNEWIAGISVGYTSGDYDVDDRQGSGDLDTINLGAYTAFLVGNWRFNGGVGVAFDDYDTSRRVTVGTFDTNANADFDGVTYTIDGTATYRFDLPGEVRLEPFAGFEYYNSETDDYSESGAGVANLSIDEQDFDALYSTLGARVHRTFVIDSHTITPELRAGWQHEWLDSDAETSARFLDGGVNGSINVVGVNPDDDAALLGAGLTADFNRKFSLRVDYDARLSSDQTDQQVTFSLRIPW